MGDGVIANYREVAPPEEVVVGEPGWDFGGHDWLKGYRNEWFPRCDLALVERGTVWQKAFAFNFVVAPDGRPFRDLTFRVYEYEAMLRRVREAGLAPSRPMFLRGTVMDLTCLGDGRNYNHWLLDCLPKLTWVGEDGWQPDRLLVNWRGRFVKDSLQALGWAPDRIVSLEETGPHVCCERLLATSPISSSFHSERVLKMVRALFEADPAREGEKRLYLSRGDATGRRVLNEGEVIRALGRFGFESVRLGEVAMTDQARMFSEAGWVVGPHGAGFANTVFCGRGTRVLEFFPPGYRSFDYWPLASTLGLRYARIECESVGAEPKMADLVVGVPRLETALLRMGLE